MSAADYTPTTAEVRKTYVYGAWETGLNGCIDELNEAAFDRWLAAHDGETDALADPTDEEVTDAARAAYDELEPVASWELLAGIDRVPWEIETRAAIVAFLTARRGQ